MVKKDSRDTEQQNPQQKGDAELSPTDVANTMGNKPDSADQGKKHAYRTQRDDDDAGYPRNWYSPKDTGVERYLNIKHWQEYSPFITVVLSAVALAVIIWQGSIIRNQTSLMAKQTSEMQVTREVENRAYVGLKSAELRRISNTSEAEIYLTAVNTGATPAHGPAWCMVFFAEDPPPEGWNPNVVNRTDLGSFVFLPSAELGIIAGIVPIYELGAGLPKKSDHGYRLKTHIEFLHPPGRKIDPTKATFYILGQIYYEDIFKARHKTNFCRYVDRDPPNQIMVCKTGNSFD